MADNSKKPSSGNKRPIDLSEGLESLTGRIKIGQDGKVIATTDVKNFSPPPPNPNKGKGAK